MSEGGIELIDKANLQKIVNSITLRHIKLDTEEEELEENLVNLSEFMAKKPEQIKGEPENIFPIQFLESNIPEFKRLTIPISRAMWTIPKVVHHMRTELYKYKIGSIMPEQLPTPPLTEPESPQNITKVEVNQSQPKESIRSKISKVVSRMTTSDPSNPYNLGLKSIEHMENIKIKWEHFLHWYYLGVLKGKTLQNDQGLQDNLDNMVIVFNFYIEPNLVMMVRYANELAKQETEQMAVQTITGYLTAKQRNIGQQPPPNI